MKAATAEKNAPAKESPTRSPAHSAHTSESSSNLFDLAAAQQSAGNLAVQQLFRAGGIKAKLSISQPGDPDEEEADRVADRVMRMPDPASAAPCSACSAGGEPCPKCAEQASSQIQRKANGTGGPPQPSVAPHVIGNLGGGHPLDKSTRAFFEPRFGLDFSHVRVHNEGRAAIIADRLGARALTVGRDIAFGHGQFSPETHDGGRLLAHELTHVVQRGGGTRDIRPATTDVLADGGLTERDMETIRQWLQSEDPTAPADPRLHEPDPRRFIPGFRLPGSGSQEIPFRPVGPEAKEHPFRTAVPGSQAGPLRTDPFTLQPLGRQSAVDDVCPSCHQTPAEIREERARREAEAAAARRREAWYGLTRTQHGEDLAQQPATLREDIQTSALTVAQLRVQMFDGVLAQRWSAPGATDITPELRDAWVQAQQAIVVLEALLRAADADIPAEVIAPVRGVVGAYYATLSAALWRRDREAEELERTLESLRLHQGPPPCPGACHQPASGTASSGGFGSGFPPNRSFALPTLPSRPSAERPREQLGLSGPRASRLVEAIERNNAAASRADWSRVLADYRWSLDEIDTLLRSSLQYRPGGRELLEQFDFTQALLQRQQHFLEEHPDALKVQAVFYPKEDVVDRTDTEGRTQPAARAIPWHFYLTRTPITDSGYVPAGYLWELHDITAPRRDDRTVRSTYQIPAIEALGRERGPWRDPKPIDQMDPPRSLFKELNHRDFFPKGVLYWTYPLSGRRDELEMTADKPFGEWLTLIGMGVALVGSLVFAPFSIPMLLAVGAGTALSITGRVLRRDEMERHGVLTNADNERFYWDLSLDLVSALTLGLGRVATVSVQAGNLLRAAQVTRYYFMVRRAQIAMDVINVGLVTHDFVQQYRAIQNSNMRPDQKSEAMRDLVLHGMLAGGLSIVMLRSAAHDLSPDARLRVDVDPSRPGRVIADIEPAAGAAAGRGARGDAHDVSRIKFTVQGESHEVTVWSDGRITRCSDPPCLLLTESVVGRLDDLTDRMLSVSRHRATMEDLAARARQLREEAEHLANGPAEALRRKSDALVQRARAIDLETAALEARVTRENDVAEVIGRDEARARYGDAALNYNREHHRWVFDRESGLQFQRRHQAVPWLKFDEASQKFVVTRTLFVPVTPERLAEIRAGSVTNQPSFRIVDTVDTIGELQRLRPYSATKQPLPSDWVLVRINDDNLVQFYTEPVPHGAIFEFPDGSRVWRTRENTIATDGPVRASIGRSGFEQSVPPELRGTGPESNLGVPSRDVTGVEHQRAHPRGAGTGFELYNHIPLAPTYVNQVLQARGIELYISEVHGLHPELDLRFTTEHATFPSTRRQSWIEYDLYVVRGGKPQRMFTVRIGTDYSNPRTPAEVEFRNFSQRPEDLVILGSPDMRAARQALEARIRAAVRQGTGSR